MFKTHNFSDLGAYLINKTPIEITFIYNLSISTSSKLQSIEILRFFFAPSQGGERLGGETSGPLLLNVWCRSRALNRASRFLLGLVVERALF